MSFVRRKINLTFRIGKDSSGVQYTFSEGDYDTVTVNGLRVQATISNPGTPSMGQASVIVHGLTPSLLNQLSSVSRPNGGQVTVRFYEMLVSAGDDVSGMTNIFQGQVTLAQVDVSGAPDSVLHIVAHGGLLSGVALAPASSYPGTADAAVIMQNLATLSNFSFQNNGVSVMLSTPYFSGSPRQQMEECANAAGINWTIENNILTIWPKGCSMTGSVPLISPSTGMIGYPCNAGLNGAARVRTLFNPLVKVGVVCQIESSLPSANGKFVIYDTAHDLESETPNGRWESSFTGVPVNG